jgi:hypothetical protein
MVRERTRSLELRPASRPATRALLSGRLASVATRTLSLEVTKLANRPRPVHNSMTILRASGNTTSRWTARYDREGLWLGYREGTLRRTSSRKSNMNTTWSCLPSLVGFVVPRMANRAPSGWRSTAAPCPTCSGPHETCKSKNQTKSLVPTLSKTPPMLFERGSSLLP